MLEPCPVKWAQHFGDMRPLGNPLEIRTRPHIDYPRVSLSRMSLEASTRLGRTQILKREVNQDQVKGLLGGALKPLCPERPRLGLGKLRGESVFVALERLPIIDHEQELSKSLGHGPHPSPTLGLTKRPRSNQTVAMRFTFVLLVAGTLLPCLALANTQTHPQVSNPQISNPWSQVSTPAQGPAESLGAASAGCLRGGVALERKGKGFKLMRPERKRHYGHPRLVTLLKSIGAEFASAKKPGLMIGDLGQPRGGPTMSAHATHQNGLDADIWYAGGAAAMVDKKKFKTTRAFGKNQLALLKRFSDAPEVDRILVHFAIKRELCTHHASEPWIRKIRPWYGHDHHFHVRLLCADSDTTCKRGDPIPEGNGCDAKLDWWFSDEARAEEKKNLNKQENPVMPVLPEVCNALVKT